MQRVISLLGLLVILCQHGLAQTAAPCSGYNSRYLRANLDLRQPQTPTATIAAHITIDQCACYSGSGVGCRVCTPNDSTSVCSSARTIAQNALSSITRLDLTAQAGSLVLGGSTTPSSQTALTRQYDINWDTTRQSDGTYQVQAISRQTSGAGVASAPAISIIVDNRPMTGANPPPSADCRDNIEISVLLPSPDTANPSNQYFSDGRQSICFNPQTRFLYSANCREGTCPAFTRLPSNQYFERIASEANGVTPSAVLCDLMQGALRDIKFNWLIGSTTREIKITQCFFSDPSNVTATGSFFGSGAYWNLEYARYLQRIGSGRASPAAAPMPQISSTCAEGSANCVIPNVCQNGTIPQGCYFLPSSSSCIGVDERFHDCQIVTDASQATFPRGIMRHSFMDRSYPSGRDGQCWATIFVGCQGTPNSIDRWFGPRPASNLCVQAIRDRNVARCQNCKAACIDQCFDQNNGACVQEYEGVGENCGVCQYRCQRSYEGCLAG